MIVQQLLEGELAGETGSTRRKLNKTLSQILYDMNWDGTLAGVVENRRLTV
jgi:hypothetical protein